MTPSLPAAFRSWLNLSRRSWHYVCGIARAKVTAVEDDRKLIREYLGGSDAAFEALYDRHQAGLHAFAYHLLGNSQDAQDLTQTAWLQAIRSLPTFRGRSSFRTWLHGIAVNLYRHQRRDDRLRTEPLDPEAADPHHALRQAEAVLALRAALAEVDPVHREVLLLHEVQGFKYREIAEILGCPVGTVKSRLHYAIAALRAALNEPSDREVEHDVRTHPAES